MNLITIISRNLSHLTPIIFEFKGRVKNHFLVYDIDEKGRAEQLKKGIEFINRKYKLDSNIHLFVLDEDSNHDYSDTFDKIQNITTKKLYLNVTEADTTISILFSNFVIDNGGKVISYDTFDNSYNLITKTKFSNETIKKSMNIDDFMEILDYKIESKKGYKDLIQNREYILELFKDFKRFFKIRNFLLSNEVDKLSVVERILLKKLNVLNDDNTIKDIGKITGMLFEEFIFWKCYELEVDDIYLGVKLEVKKSISNEFDILMIKDNHIYTIECKLGNNINGNNIIYKSDSLLEFFGDDSKNLIINITTKEIENLNECIDVSEIFTYSSNVRALDNNISIYHKKSFKNESFYKKVSKFFNLRRRVFLLGGMDLEMATIKALLKHYNIKFYDNNLKWNEANLSSYKNRLNNIYHFYGIELNEDIKPPKYYTKIDHHNELSDRECSLKQVSDILGVKLSKKGELICANDSAYISGMKKLGATKKEIEKIRKQDRKFQGVTEEDEKLAIESIKNNLDKKSGFLIIYSLTDKFSPIVDRLEYDSLIVYNDSKIVVYGKKAYEIANKNYKLVEQGIAYYGGMLDNGFFGIKENEFSKSEIEDFIKKIVENG